MFRQMHVQLLPGVEGLSAKLAGLILGFICCLMVASLKHNPRGLRRSSFLYRGLGLLLWFRQLMLSN